MAKIKITLVKSPIGSNKNIMNNIQALGLTKLHSSVVKEDLVQFRGMINKISHLVKVENVTEEI